MFEYKRRIKIPVILSLIQMQVNCERKKVKFIEEYV